MKRYLHWIALLLLLATLGFDAWFWGGAARMPDVGPILRDNANRQAMLTATYMGIGDVVGMVGSLRDSSNRYAAEALAPIGETLRKEPMLAVDRALAGPGGSGHTLMRILHPLPPVFLLLWIIGLLIRPKTVHLVGSRRR
jgi:hypothetical protein